MNEAIDPDLADFLRQLDQPGAPAMRDLPIAEVRSRLRALWATVSPPPCPVAAIEDIELVGADGAVPCRVYRPRVGGGSLPALVYVHGGAFCALSPRDYDATNTALANAANCVVVAPDYRLAPEHPFPAAIEDVLTTYSGLAARAAELGVDPRRFAVAGDSAGGSLAAALCLLLRERAISPPRLQVLVTPMTDGAARTRSRITKSAFIDAAEIDAAVERYAGARRLDPRVSPLRAPDHRGLPPALVLTAAEDPMRDEGRAYAEVLREAGVPAWHHCYEGMIHGFFSMGRITEQGNLAVEHVAGALRHAFRAMGTG